MSSLWTPDGERPVGREAASPPAPTPPADLEGVDPEDLSPTERAELEAMAERMTEVRAQLASVPAATVVANHAMGLYELAAIHLSSDPPKLTEAQVAVDAMGGVVDACQGRLGDAERVLGDALAQIRLAFVQVRAALEEDAAGAGA